MPAAKQEEVVACCSFCLKPNTEVKALVAGPAVYVCDECVDLCNQIIGDLPRFRPRGRGGTETRLTPWDRTDSLDAALSNLPKAALAQAQVEASLVGWVCRARTLGATWAQIGDALGITRQSAWERFAAAE
jgi:hypothetical protein